MISTKNRVLFGTFVNERESEHRWVAHASQAQCCRGLFVWAHAAIVGLCALWRGASTAFASVPMIPCAVRTHSLRHAPAADMPCASHRNAMHHAPACPAPRVETPCCVSGPMLRHRQGWFQTVRMSSQRVIVVYATECRWSRCAIGAELRRRSRGRRFRRCFR